MHINHKDMTKLQQQLPSIFTLLRLKKCVGLKKLKSDLQSCNFIKINLVVFQFHPLTFDFLCFFLSNLILILLIHIYFAFNFFF